MAAAARGDRGGAALSALASSHSRANTIWLRARLPLNSPPARRSISSAAPGQLSPRAGNGWMGSPASSWAGAEPVSSRHRIWLSPTGVSCRGLRLRISPPASTSLGGRDGRAPGASPSAAVQLPLESRHTHSPSPVSVKGWAVCSSRTDASAAVASQ